jgi:hypothetical protein
MTRKEIENLIITVIRQNDMRNRQGKNLLDVFNGLLDYIQSESEESGEITDIRNLLNTCVGLPAYDSQSYKITFTTIAGASVEIDLPIEQLALRYNPETESIEFDNHDGTTTSIPVSAFVKVYLGSIGEQIQISIDNQNTIHATLLKNSVSWDHLSVELQQRVNEVAENANLAAAKALEAAAAAAPVIEEIEGSTATIDVQPNHIYKCGELTSLKIQSVVDSPQVAEVIFQSGATATELSLPDTLAGVTGWQIPQPNKTYKIFFQSNTATINE